MNEGLGRFDGRALSCWGGVATMEKLTEAFRELDASDIEAIVSEFAWRAEVMAEANGDWSRVYALIACAAVDALHAK